jgi:DNA polymerase theta
MALDLRVSKSGLRDSFVHALRDKGISDFYAWQAEALAQCQQGENFVYMAPTSGGKSLVADVLMLKRMQAVSTDWRKPSGQALVLVPFLSIGALHIGLKVKTAATLFRSLTLWPSPVVASGG